MNSQHQKNFVLAALCGILVIMGIGYAAFAQQLTINGSATITSNWDVEITGIVSGTPVGTATVTNAPTFTATSATFSTTLLSPSDSITYTITVQNKGTIDAELGSITETSGNTNAITNTVSGLTQGESLKAGDTKTFTVTTTYNSSVTSQPADADLTSTYTLVLNYVQA